MQEVLKLFDNADVVLKTTGALTRGQLNNLDSLVDYITTAFDDDLPDDIHSTYKCYLNKMESRIEQSLAAKRKPRLRLVA